MLDDGCEALEASTLLSATVKLALHLPCEPESPFLTMADVDGRFRSTRVNIRGSLL